MQLFELFFLEAGSYVPSTVLAIKIFEVFKITVYEIFKLDNDDLAARQLFP